jgi:hypothetical protein
VESRESLSSSASCTTSKVKQSNKGCVTLWPCPFRLKQYLKGKSRMMKTQIFHHARI